VARQNSTAETIDQKMVKVSSKPEEKRAALRAILRGEKDLKNAIIFCNRKRDVATLARSLQRHGFSAGGLHGDMDQKSRMETLDAFKTDKLKLLIASDVAARGLDIPAVSHVINFDVPTHAEDYVHRIGRTGRAGRSGTSITLAAPSDGKYVDAIVKLIQRDIPVTKLEGALGFSDDADAHEARPRRDRHRGERKSEGHKGDHKSGDLKPRVHKADDHRAEGAPAEKPQKAADGPSRSEAQAPRRTPSAPRSHPPGAGAHSPFGSDGPVPAFLLRPGNVR
jgi:superfamily II DNA/RNA helicase